MDVIATQRFIRISPRKIRPIANMVKDLSPTQAVKTLPYIGKRAAEPLAKVIKTALANAKAKGLKDKGLVFKEIQIGDGPRLKRGRWVAKGRWHPYQKRMSHIRVVLTAEPQASSGKLQTDSKGQNKKSKK